MTRLQRRGFDLGRVPDPTSSNDDIKSNWLKGIPTKLDDACKDLIEQHQQSIARTENLVLQILEGESADEILPHTPYSSAIGDFNLIGCTFNEGDEQEIETVLFDQTVDGNVICDDLWMKVSWLSFFEEDASLRFRFSFGVDLVEDVSADPVKQQASAELAEAVFPECQIITENQTLIEHLQGLLGHEKPSFVERILYFNAPEGGAYLHHDLERGHAGVVYAQVSGSTLWLALPKLTLVNEIQAFLKAGKLPNSLSEEQKRSLIEMAFDQTLISAALDSFKHDALIHLINETEEFVQRLITNGHFRILNPGDIMLLSQANKDTCCWHSVFCLGEEIGQALSFAVK